MLPSHQGTPRGPLSPTDLGPVSRGSALWWSGTVLLTAGQRVQARTGPGWGARARFRTLLSPHKYASPARRTHPRGARVPSRLCVPSPGSPGGLALCPHPPPPWEARPGRKSLTDPPRSRAPRALFSLRAQAYFISGRIAQIIHHSRQFSFSFNGKPKVSPGHRS